MNILPPIWEEIWIFNLFGARKQYLGARVETESGN